MLDTLFFARGHLSYLHDNTEEPTDKQVLHNAIKKLDSQIEEFLCQN